ncbi:MAG: hypothetical protein N2039_03870 [Gemmataceae bacterium]|nr:hypothetical protein [Gemmataceae bacterium]
MPRIGLILAVIGTYSLLGCVPLSSVGRAIPLTRPKLMTASPEPPIIVMDIAPLVVPLGDRFVNEEIWTSLDEQILTTRQRHVLQQNGFRVGLAAGGRTPEGLRQLLTGKKTNPNPYQSRRQEGNAASVTLAKGIDECEVELHLNDKPEIRRYQQLVCQVKLVPSVDHDGSVRLQVTPQLEFEDPEKWSRLNPRLALAVQGQRSTETFELLNFDLTLGDNDFLVLGARYDSPESLAARFFLSPDPQKPTQRLLAIRAAPLSKISSSTSAQNNLRSQSLAAQAAAR